MSRAPLMDEEGLETLVYHRSKQWSSLMTKWANGDDGQELCVADLEEIFKDEHEDPEMDGEEEDGEAIEDPVPETKVDLGNISASMGVAELTLILCAGEDNEVKAEMQEILNQTMPVVQEHKRKWKEAGLDRILDTFDEKQIEQHVGQWMRRNNSAFLEHAPPAKCLYVSVSEPSDNESLHSIDTARYIRQSRRRVPNKISNTATIKMYRTHSHKRDELRAKYAYDDEQEHRHHMQTLLHRRREKERQVTYVSASPQHCILSSGHHQRRKHRRKRHASSPVFDYSSSDDDDRSYGRCACRSCLTHHHSSLSRSASYQCCSYRGTRDCHQHHHHHHRSMASRTMHHLRRQHSYDLDLRPRLRESECNCCSSDRLCSNVVHIANSSTEEWVVENCSSSSSPLVVETPKKFRQKHQLVTIRKPNTKLTLSKPHKQRIPKSVTTASTSNLIKSQVSLLGESSEDDHEGSPRKLMIKPIASAPDTARKTQKVGGAALTFMQKQVPTKQNQGDSKKLPADIVSSSEESEEEVKERFRLVAKNSKKESASKRTLASNKPIFWTTNRLSKIPEEVVKAKEPEVPAFSTEICKKNEACSAEKPEKTSSKQPLEEQKTQKKSKMSAIDSSDTNDAKTSSKSRGRPRTSSDSGKKSATLNKGFIKTKIGPANKDMAQWSDESEDEVIGKSRKQAEPRGRHKNSATAAIKKERTKKTKSSGDAKESQESLSGKLKAPKAKTSNKKQKKGISSESSSLDKATDSEDLDFQRALALSTETYKEEQMKQSQQPLETQPQLQSQSQLVFNNNSVACNSTAVANDTACTRVLSPKKRGSKRTAAVSSTEAQQQMEVITLDSSAESVVAKGGDADCTVVTSTTICEPAAAVAARKPSPLKISKRGILLHNSSAGAGANFTLTEQSLGEVIGGRLARRYLKYHVGSRTFDSSHSVYYRPTPKLAEALRASSMDTQVLANLSSSDSSDDDVFDRIRKYGDVYSVAESGVKHKD